MRVEIGRRGDAEHSRNGVCWSSIVAFYLFFVTICSFHSSPGDPEYPSLVDEFSSDQVKGKQVIFYFM